MDRAEVELHGEGHSTGRAVVVFEDGHGDQVVAVLGQYPAQIYRLSIYGEGVIVAVARILRFAVVDRGRALHIAGHMSSYGPVGPPEANRIEDK